MPYSWQLHYSCFWNLPKVHVGDCNYWSWWRSAPTFAASCGRPLVALLRHSPRRGSTRWAEAGPALISTALWTARSSWPVVRSLGLSFDAARWLGRKPTNWSTEIFQGPLLPQLIPRSLPSRHEMSAFLRRIRILHPKTSPRTEGDKSANSTPAVRACVYSLERRDTCSCRARHCAPMPSAGGHARGDGCH